MVAPPLRPGWWIEAYQRLHEADAAAHLQPNDLEALATSAHLIGRDDSTEIWARAHQDHLARGDSVRAAGSAFWLAFTLVNQGDLARASGWIGRAVRLLDDDDHEAWPEVPAGVGMTPIRPTR